MELTVLQRNEDCNSCTLSQTSRSVCIPTRQFASVNGATTCVLCVGDRPGLAEGKADAHLVGQAGLYFKKVFYKWVEMNTPTPFDVYVTNAVRCMPPANSPASEKQLKACHPYLESDIQWLKASYDEVVILAMGAAACKTLGLKNFGDGCLRQGKTSSQSYGCRVFTTHNPFKLHHDPSQVHSVRDHLGMLIDYLTLGTIPAEVAVPAPHVAPTTVASGTQMVCVDIETYGAVEGLPVQTVFNPHKALLADGVATKDLIQTIAAAWRLPDGALTTGIWVMPNHLQQFQSWLLRATYEGADVLGMNLPFDLMFMRAFDPSLKRLLGKSRLHRCGSRLLDVAVGNFLNSDVRHERSLKEIAPLLRILDYDEEVNLKKGERYPSKWDKKLHHYNVKDTVATIEAWERLEARTKRDYKKTVKFSDECLQDYSDTLWTVIRMDENGVPLSRPRLQRIEDYNVRVRDRIVQWVRHKHGGFLCSSKVSPYGKSNRKIHKEFTGPKQFVQDIVDRAATESGMLADKRLIKTDKRGDISTKQDNINLFLGALPVGHDLRGLLRMVGVFRGAQKLVGTYTHPLLNDTGKGMVGDMAFPSWFTVPTFEKEGAGSSGGTQQGRLTCKNPAIQTMPSTIKDCIISRWPEGVFLAADLSQIELRVAALWSGDERMMDDYLQGKDRHASTAGRIFDEFWDLDPKGKKYYKYRHIGKTLNFLVLYRGGAKTFQETLRRDRWLPMEMPIAECVRIIREFDRAHRRFREWQDELVETAVTTGRLEMPFVGDSRTFVGGRKTIEQKYLPTIANFPVQDCAAWIMKSAQAEIGDMLENEKFKAKMCFNIYDSVGIDCQTSTEAVRVLKRLGPMMQLPPFYKKFQEWVGRELPLDYDVEIYR